MSIRDYELAKELLAEMLPGAKVVGFTPGHSTIQQNLDVVAEDFGRLFLDQIRLTQNILRL